MLKEKMQNFSQKDEQSAEKPRENSLEIWQ